MKKYIYKAAASCALVLAFAACQKESTVATSNSNNSVESSTTEKTQVVFNVGTSELSRTTDLAPLFNVSMEEIETNGFYLYVIPDSSEAVFVKMLYRTLEGGSIGSTYEPLSWYPYEVFNGYIIDQKECRKTFNSSHLDNSQITAIYSGSRVLTETEVKAGVTIDFPAQYSSLDNMASYNILYASLSEGTIINCGANADYGYATEVQIKLKSPLAMITVEPNELYQSESSYFESVTISDVAYSCTIQTTDENSNTIITGNATATPLTMFKTSSAALAQVDSTALSNDETSLFVAFLPPQMVSDGKFTVKTSTSEEEVVFDINDYFTENSHVYCNLNIL